MYASTEPATILYITERSHNGETLDVGLDSADRGITLKTIARAESSALPGDRDSVACVLLGADLDRGTTLELLADIEDVPVLVFADEREDAFVEQLLQAGAADVLQSTAETMPPALLERRLEVVTEHTAMSRDRESLLDRYETLLDTAADAIYQLDIDGFVVEANEATAELTGYSRANLLGSHLSRFVDEETLAESTRLRSEQLDGDRDEVTSLDIRIEHRGGGTIPCRVRTAVLREDGDAVGWVGVARDMREAREREAELERVRELLTNAERLGDVGVWELDPHSDRLFWSAGARRICGAGEELEPTAENVLGFYHPADRDRISALVERCQETAESFSTQARIITGEGDQRWVRLKGEAIETDNELHNVRGYIQDITERIEREQELQRERDLIEQVFEASPIGIVSVASDGTITRANEQAASILGAASDALEGSHYADSEMRVLGPDGSDVPAEEYPAARILDAGQTVHDEEMQVERPNGDRRIIAVDGAPLVDGDRRQAVLTFEDVTEDVERETRLTAQRNELAQLDHINRIIRGVDQALLAANTRDEIVQAVCERLSESGKYRFALALQSIGNDHFEPETWAGPADSFIDAVFPLDDQSADSSPAMRALETGSIQVIQDLTDPEEFEPAPWYERAIEEGVRGIIAIPIVYEEQTYGVISAHAQYVGSFTDRELDVLGELGETVGYAIAAVKRREREEILTSLYETTQDLLAAETEQLVTDAVVDAADEVLDPPGIGIFLFDDERNVLAPATATEALIDFYGSETEFGPGHVDSATWQAYATGETAFFPDIRESDRLANPETAARSTLMIPLGEHGVFVVSATERGVFGEEKQRLIGLLAATTEAALDRVAGRADIRERDRELAEHAARVDRLEETLSVVRAIVRLLGEARTRQELETGACEQFASLDSNAFAWIGRLPPDSETVEPQAWAGDEAGYLDAVSLQFSGGEPAARAARAGELVTVEDVTDSLQRSDWARQAANRGVQSVAAVPLVYGETTYGVLAVYATEPGAFDERAQSVLQQLAGAVAYGVNAIETNQGVLADQLTELELVVDTPNTFLNRVAAVAGTPVTYHEITPQSGGTARVLFALESAPVEEVMSLESEFVSVESLTHLERGDEQLFRVTLSGPTVGATVLACGAIPRRIVATGDETRAVVRLSREIDVRVFLDRLQQQYPAELLSRKDVERTEWGEGLFSTLDTELTDRQREVLVTAYESGFFQSPRETTGEQLAALLDLSQPTVTHHLREAQRRIFATLLEG